jgi:predicted RNA-binding Zn-ribbon protein involved in translation (DUF1610 family)
MANTIKNHKIVLEIEGDRHHVEHIVNICIQIAQLPEAGKIKRCERVSEMCHECGIMLKSTDMVASCLLGFVCPQCHENSYKRVKKKK